MRKALKLHEIQADAWVPVGDGASIHVKRPTVALIAAAQNQAQKMVLMLVAGSDALSYIGITPDMIRAGDESFQVGLAKELTVRALAKYLVTNWMGFVGSDGKELRFSHEDIDTVMNDPEVADIFWNHCMSRQIEEKLEGNVSPLSQSGTSAVAVDTVPASAEKSAA